MMDIADYLHRTLEAREDAATLAKIREEVHSFSRKFPLPFEAALRLCQRLDSAFQILSRNQIHHLHAIGQQAD